LGAAWSTAAPAPSKTPELTCTAFNPRTSRVIERGAASSATFAQSAGGPFFAQVGYVYAAPAQEQELWGKVVRPDLGRCFKQSLVAGSGGGVRYTAAGVKRLSLPKLAVSAAAYRVTGTAATTDQTLPVYLDAIVFGHGADISEISLSSFDQPVARGLEVRLARAVARRLAPGA
jgi:hypothetical protein